MFTFVISLVVVGAALFLATRVAIGPAPKLDKPATPVTRRVGAPQGAPEPAGPWGPLTEVGRVPTARRIRSGVVLIVTLTTLGAIVALALVIFGAVVLSALRSAVQ